MELLTIFYALLAAITGISSGDRAVAPQRAEVAASAISGAVAERVSAHHIVAIVAARPVAPAAGLAVTARVRPAVLSFDAPLRRFASTAFAPRRE